MRPRFFCLRLAFCVFHSFFCILHFALCILCIRMFWFDRRGLEPVLPQRGAGAPRRVRRRVRSPVHFVRGQRPRPAIHQGAAAVGRHHGRTGERRERSQHTGTVGRLWFALEHEKRTNRHHTPHSPPEVVLKKKSVG